VRKMNRIPFGMHFAEEAPDMRIEGRYDEKLDMWVDENRIPNLIAAGTATGSNASTGALYETDLNEDYD